MGLQVRPMRRRASRDEWARRVERWRRSGLTAKAFAVDTGLNAHTLKFWKWQLGAERKRRSERLPAKAACVAVRSPFVEVVADLGSGGSGVDSACVVEAVLAGGLRLSIPVELDERALARVVALVAALEAR